MFRILSGIPSRLKNLFALFKPHFTKPQFNNFCRTELALISAAKKEHDIKSLNNLFINKKDQSTLNRFFTNSKWTPKNILTQAKQILLKETNKHPTIPKTQKTIEHRSIDDTVCKKYSPNTEMACYNHSTTQGNILSHDYVTSIYHTNQIKIPDNIKLYGNKKKCEQKNTSFKTKIELACEIIDEHEPVAEQTIMHWDSWYMCREVVEHCKTHGYRWIGDIKGNRIIYFGGERLNVTDLYDRLRSEGRFVDVCVGGEIYLACKVIVYVPEVGEVSILINAQMGTSDVHFLCSDLVELSVFELVEMALLRHKIEEFHKEAKGMGFGEYRFHQSEAALIHAHLVCVALILLDVLRRRLLRYGIKQSLLTMAGTAEWVGGWTSWGLICSPD